MCTKMKRSVIFIELLLCVAIGFYIILRSPLPGPKYKGRALVSWLADLGQPHTQEAARKAIVEGGANTVPGLLEIRFARDTRLDFYVKVIGSRIDSRFRPRREALRYRAAEALRLLGTNAAFAMIPLFATNNLLLSSSSHVSVNPFLFEQQPVSELAEVMLFDLHTNSVPAFIAGLRGSNLLIRFNLCYSLASKPTFEVHQNRDLARALIDAVIPTLSLRPSPAAPTSPLPNGPLLSMALHALLQLGVRQHDHEAIIPHVIALLDDPDSGVRYNAAHFLKQLAPKTEQVRNALQNAIDEEEKNPSDDTMGAMMIGSRSKEVLLRGYSDALQANQ